MRSTFTLCTLASVAVIASAIAAKALASPAEHAALTGVSSSAGTRTALGPAIPLAHGLVQVQITCVGTRIVNIVAVQLPHDSGFAGSDQGNRRAKEVGASFPAAAVNEPASRRNPRLVIAREGIGGDCLRTAGWARVVSNDRNIVDLVAYVPG